MFNFVHENKRLVQAIMALIILPFAFWGVESYTRSGNSADVVATVEGAKITRQEFDNALRQQQEKIRQQMGANFDASLLETPEIKRAVLEGLVENRLLIERAKASGLAVTDEQVVQIIESEEAFHVDGKFNKNRYEAVLAANKLAPLSYEARLREELLGQQIQDTYTQNGYAANSVAENVIRLNEQQRVVSIVPVSFKPFMAQAKINESALKAYYEQNQKEFQVQEQVKVEYVKLSADDLLPRVEVGKEEAQQYYNEHQSDFGTPEERQAAHILITVNAAAPQAEQDAAKAKAEQLLRQVKQNPASFSDLAKKNSQDPGSAAKGGDLGFFGRGAMVKPFEDAAFALKVGEISGLVKSDFGYHIIKLIAVKPARILPLEEAREGIVNKLRQQKAADMFAEMAEKFSNTVYEQSDTLKPAADLVGTKIQQSDWLVKGAVAGEPWTPKMLQAIFNDEVLKNKRNTAAIEVSTNVLVSARMLEYKPAAVRSFNEVRESISQKLQQQQALELAANQGKKTLEQLQHGDKPKLAWESVQTVTRAKHGSLDIGLVRQIFQANTSTLPQYVGAEDEQNGYTLVRIDSVKEGEAIDDAKRAGYAQQLRQLTGEEMSRAYIADAKQHASIKLN